MKLVCLFSHPRTGTNYLHSVLRQWPGVVALGEVFHENEAFGLRPAHLAALAGPAGRSFAGAADPALVAWVRDNPAKAITTLARMARNNGRDALYFKVFPGQWPNGLAADLPALARLPGFTPVVLQRRMLDVYVSYCKVARINQYKTADTTDVPIRLWADAFEIWANESRAWYREVMSLLEAAGTPALHASYERDVDMAPQALSDHWARLLGLPGGPVDATQALTRQDRTPSLEDKLGPHASFVAEAKRIGVWEMGLGGFL